MHIYNMHIYSKQKYAYYYNKAFDMMKTKWNKETDAILLIAKLTDALFYVYDKIKLLT